MISKGSLAIIALIIFPMCLAAQDATSGFHVETNPPGAEVSLIGVITISGLTPVSFNQGLEGEYQIRIEKYGYETYKSSVFLQNGRAINLTVNLKSKTRLKAAARSLVIPGWGQSYTNQKSKGLLFGLAAVGGIASFLITDSDFNNKNKTYENYLSEYNRAATFSEKERLFSLVADAKKKAYDAETTRRISIGATVAIWSLNIMDIFLFFPETGGSMTVSGLSIKPDINSSRTLLTFSYRF